MSGGAESRLFAHAATMVHGARAGYLRTYLGHSHRRNAAAELHPERGNALYDAEWVRLRLRRLRWDACAGEKVDWLGRVEEKTGGGSQGRPMDRHRHWLDARFRHQQFWAGADHQQFCAFFRAVQSGEYQA